MPPRHWASEGSRTSHGIPIQPNYIRDMSKTLSKLLRSPTIEQRRHHANTARAILAAVEKEAGL